MQFGAPNANADSETGWKFEGVYSPFVSNTRVYVTLPDGSRTGFTFTPTAHAQTGVVYYTPTFTADAGGTYSLASASGTLARRAIASTT